MLGDELLPRGQAHDERFFEYPTCDVGGLNRPTRRYAELRPYADAAATMALGELACRRGDAPAETNAIRARCLSMSAAVLLTWVDQVDESDPVPRGRLHRHW